MSDAPLRIVEIDPHNEADYQSWYAVLASAAAIDRPDAGPFVLSLQEMRTEHVKSGGLFGYRHGLALSDNAIVGISLLCLPVRENLDSMELTIVVSPEYRRRRVGSRLYEHAVDVARASGRTKLLGEFAFPVGTVGPGQGFALALGFSVAATSTHRRLDLPADPMVLDDLRAEATEQSADYRIEVWDEVPPPSYDAYARLLSAMATDTPMGNLDHEPVVWDVERLTTVTARRRAQGRRDLTAVAFAKDGTLVGNSELVTKPEWNGHVLQANTLVLRGHRGHRLGLAMKLATLEALPRRETGCVAVHTSNEDTNTPIIALNDRLGYQPLEHEVIVQRRN